MSCNTVSSFSNTRSSAYFTVWMICLPILKSPNPSKASLIRHSLYTLNRTGDKQHPCLTPLSIFTLHVSPQFIPTSTLWAMYKFLINLLSHKSIPVPFRICVNLTQLTRSNAFYQSMKQTHSSTSISKVHSCIILSIPIAFLVPFPLLNPNWSSSIWCRSWQQVSCGQSQYLPQAVSAHPSHCFWIDASHHATYNTKNPCVRARACTGQAIL